MGEEDPIHPRPDWTTRNLFRIGFFFELGLVLPAALLGVWLGDAPFPFRLELDLEGALLGLLATLPMAGLAFVFTSRAAARIGFLHRIHEKVKAIMGDALKGMSLEEIILLSAAAGIGEEVLFRGTLQTIIGEPWGLWVQGLLFGLLHALTPAYFVLAALMGLYFGWLQAATDNLLVPILVHALYDALALWRMRRELRGGEPP